MSGARVKALIKSWEDFNVESFQNDLDEIAGEITDRQEVSEGSRASLVGELEEFLRDEKEGKSARLGNLLGSFQKEVDLLTRRSQEAEKGFLKLYSKVVSDFKDPVPLLEEIREGLLPKLGKVQDLEIEVAQLRETVGDYEAELLKSKGKEKKLAELKAKVQSYDRNIDATLQERIGEVTEKVFKESQEKIEEIAAEKNILVNKLSDSESKYNDVQSKFHQVQTELFDLKRKKEEKSEAASSEIEILFNDLESAQNHATIVEKEKESLKEEVELLKSRIQEEKKNPQSDDTTISLREFDAKTREVQRLIDDNSRLKSQNEALETYYEEKIGEAENKSLNLEEKLSSLEEKLRSFSDYDIIKKELNVFKALEFNQDENEAEEKKDKKPLEVLILERSKVLQANNSSLRLENQKLKTESDDLRAELNHIISTNSNQKNLISELENHVESLQLMSMNSRGEAEGRSSADVLSDALNFEGAEKIDHTRIDKNALLPIIKAQRERFRARTEVLEEVQSRQIHQISNLQEEISVLQKDNVKLYEKIKFLQSAAPNSNRRVNSYDDVESRYQSKYEQHLNPFTSFNRREKNRQYEQLNIIEKIILSMVRFMMSNKTARFLVFVYSILLHVLVFTVLMKMAYHDASIRAEWREKYAQHMLDVHNEDHIG